MIITVKNLQQQTFTVNFPVEKTVYELKQQIFKERGPEYVVEKQKLIYAGVILDDARTIASYNVHERKFVVVMMKRDIGTGQRPEESPAPATPSSVEVVTTATAPVSAGDESAASSSGEAVGVMATAADMECDTDNVDLGVGNSGIRSNVTEASMLTECSGDSDISDASHLTYSSADLAGVLTDTSQQYSRAESNWLIGEEYQRSIDSMIEMGYRRDVVERAMAASFNNPERAVEYLLSGIPEINEEAIVVPANAPDDPAVPPLANVAAVQPSIGDIVGPAGDQPNRNDSLPMPAEAGGDRTQQQQNRDPFEFLRNQPQFLQMRSLVYQNPELLHAVLQQIGQTNPALLLLISENQDAFLNMLNQPMPGQAGNAQNPRRMTPGRARQISAMAHAASGGDGLHMPQIDTSSGAGGDGIPARNNQRETGDAGADSVPPDHLSNLQNRAAERRAAAIDTYLRERAAAAAAVAALTAAASTAVDQTAVRGAANAGANNRNIALDNAGGVGRATELVADTGGADPLNRLNTSSQPLSNIATDVGIGTIELTPQDRDAIQRLIAMGFPENLVVEAYFACDKNEELAANFLVSSAFDD